MTRALLAFVLVTALAATADAGGATAIAAHRGGAALWPENSLLAFRNAIALGVDVLELDVHQTVDGELVVIHDPTLERTTTGRGAIRDLTRGQLATIRLRGPEGAVTDEPLPTLAAVVDLAAPAPVRLLPEIKVARGRERYAGIEERLLELLRARGLLGRTTIQAFEAETIATLRQLEPTVSTMLLVSRTRVERERVWPSEAVRWAVAAGATDLGIDHRVVDARVVAAARKAGVRLGVWTVDDERDLAKMLALGVDLIITNRPDAAMRLRAR